jgi:hypothetical protein
MPLSPSQVLNFNNQLNASAAMRHDSPENKQQKSQAEKVSSMQKKSS